MCLGGEVSRALLRRLVMSVSSAVATLPRPSAISIESPSFRRSDRVCLLSSLDSLMKLPSLRVSRGRSVK
jgi:hypothetical protein